MKQLYLTFFIICFYAFSFGQTLEGKVYDSKSTVKNIKVLNKTQNRLTVTDKDGNFSIVAKVNDTISFESLFYHPKEIILKQIHFDDINVFEIKKIVSELDEVEIETEPEQPVFEEETYNETLQNLIKEDIKRNPGLYQPQNAQSGVDFIYLIGQVVKLFKRKKPKTDIYGSITYKTLDSLFNKSTFFTKNLLIKDLNIPEDNTKLFLDFCAAKGISSALLKDEKQVELLEEFVLNSQLFLMLLEEYGKENIETIKD